MLQMVRKKAPGSTVAENTSLSDYTPVSGSVTSTRSGENLTGGEHVLERLHTRFRLGDKYEIWGELDDSDLTFPCPFGINFYGTISVDQQVKKQIVIRQNHFIGGLPRFYCTDKGTLSECYKEHGKHLKRRSQVSAFSREGATASRYHHRSEARRHHS